jgi:hypothetical protein
VNISLKDFDFSAMNSDNNPFTSEVWTDGGEYTVSLFKKSSSQISFNGGPMPDLMADNISFSSETTTVSWSEFKP